MCCRPCITVKYCSQVMQLGNATYNTTDHHFDTYVEYKLVSAVLCELNSYRLKQ